MTYDVVILSLFTTLASALSEETRASKAQGLVDSERGQRRANAECRMQNEESERAGGPSG